MTNKTDTASNSAFLSAEVDASKIFESLVQISNGLRSSDPVTKGRIPRADEKLDSKDGESLFNAFLRAIGMPAVRDDELLGKDINNEQKSQDGTLNYFQYTDIGLNADDVAKVIQREQALAANRPIDYQATPDKANVLSGLQFMLSPPAPDAGVKGEGGRRSIFPLVACGDVTVYPLSNRTKPMFGNSGDPNGYVQQRCFLEFILITKFAAKQTEISSELREAIKVKLLSIGVAEGSNAPDPRANEKQAIIGNLGNEEVFSLRVIQKLFQALEASAIDYAESKKLVRSYMQDVTYVPVFNGRSPFVRQGNFEISYEEIIKFLDENDPNKKIELGLDKKPRLDAAIDSLDLEKTQSEQFFDIFIPAANKPEDDIDFLLGAGSGEAFGTGTFEDIVVSICTLDRNRVDEEIKSKKSEMTRIRAELELLRSKLDIYSGYTYGLSIFDFLAIILSLYILPQSTISELVNAEGRNRFFETRGSFPSTGLSASAERKKFEETVTQVLNIARAAFDKAEKGSK